MVSKKQQDYRHHANKRRQKNILQVYQYFLGVFNLNLLSKNGRLSQAKNHTDKSRERWRFKGDVNTTTHTIHKHTHSTLLFFGRPTELSKQERISIKRISMKGRTRRTIQEVSAAKQGSERCCIGCRANDAKE